MIPDLTRVLAADYLTALSSAPIDQVRSMRAECADLENGASFVRRLAQGRVDVLLEETKRRAEGGGGSLGELVESLASTLSDGSRGPASGRADQELEPPEDVVDPLTAVLDSRVPPSVVSSVAELDDPALSAAIIALRDFEEELSNARRLLHETIDSVNTELARRIAGGESPAGID